MDNRRKELLLKIAKSEFVDPMDFVEILEVQPEAVDTLFTVVTGQLPEGYRWKFLWGSEFENTPQADDLALLLLNMEISGQVKIWQEIPGGYVGGSLYLNPSNPELSWSEWGIGCPMSAATSDIWVAVKE